MSEPEPSSNNRGRILDTFAELVTRKRAKWLILVVWIVIVGTRQSDRRTAFRRDRQRPGDLPAARR